MTDWKKVTGTQPERPEEIDRTSSPSTVYLRKNIEQVEKEDVYKRQFQTGESLSCKDGMTRTFTTDM